MGTEKLIQCSYSIDLIAFGLSSYEKNASIWLLFCILGVYELSFVKEEKDDDLDRSMLLRGEVFFGTLLTIVFHEDIVWLDV